ncbi:hypothetical protein B0H17DRAFT_1198698 [Mycena rosella]|uniref:Uncharacterized protein n=1 Tax=Mycena rosella TaxID=1033263 RepID=A0AAD7GN25_MYCRO|nr:hypothetical protein B0H17DRAFT_1198698 [Mycena rosella]
MATRPEMEGVARAIDSLKKVSSKDKSDKIQTAIGELSSILSLLNLSTASRKILGRLNKIFRDNLHALYAAYPVLMCRFCAAVLGAIFTDKVETAGDLTLQRSWEDVQKSVVSSILDFLEQHPSMSNKTVAGNLLFPTICDMFYPRGTSFKWTSPSLIFNVNLLLTEAATDCPDNQSQLRTDKVLGATRIGFALSQHKDFFVVDSLVAFIGVLLPARTTASKRSEFVDAVFTPRLFSCSSQIKRLIAGSSSTEWDPVVTQITTTLAESDISFPQPFYVIGLRSSTSLPNVVDPLYVDHQGLFANIEREGVLDSYQVPFDSVERIKLSAPGAFTTPVSIHLTSPPLIGAAEPDGDNQQQCSLVFQLKNDRVARFLEALKARGVGKLISDADRKVSKIAEGLSLEFDPSAPKPPTQQEKVAKVEQLWKSNGDPGLGEPTSPLVAQLRASSDTHSDQREASSQHDAIYGDDLSDVSDGEKPGPKAKSSAPPSTKGKSSRVRIVLDSDDEDTAAVQQPRATQPRKSAMKKPAVIEADDEEEDIDPTQSPPSNAMDEDFEPTQPETQTRPEPAAKVPARVTRGAAKKNPTLATSVAEPRKAVSTHSAVHDVPDADVDVSAPARSIRRPANTKRAVPADEQLSEDEIEISRPSSKAQETSANDSRPEKRLKAKANAAPATKVKASKSVAENGRKRADNDQEVSDEDVSDRRPTKRLRGVDSAPDEPLPPAAPPRRDSAAVFGDRSVNPAPAKKRYGGKKGRPSSPVPSDAPDTAMAIDYDELPAPHSPAPPPAPERVIKAAKQEAGVDTRKSRVAAMKGKAGQKPAPRKPEPAAKASPKTTWRLEHDDKESESEEPPPPRRSTRTAKDHAAPKPVQAILDDTIPIPKPKAKPQKPKKAPWEDMHLKKNDVIPSSDEPPADVPVDVEMDDTVATLDGPATESDSFEEFSVPGSFSPPPEDEDVTMLDVVQDVSPKTKILQPVLLTFAVPVASNPDPVELTIPLPKIKAIPAFPAVQPEAASAALESPKVVDATAPTRQQAHFSPATKSEPILPLPKIKFKAEVPPRPIQPVSLPQKLPTPSPARPSKLPTPVPAKQPRPVHAKKVPTPPARSPPAHLAAYTPSRPPPRQARAPSRQIPSDSSFPERVSYPTAGFAPSRTSSPLVQRTNSQFVPAGRAAKHHAHERTPELGRHGRTNLGRGPHRYEVDERDHDYKLNKSLDPMQGIFEKLNAIHEAVAENITQRFHRVGKDVRVGRDVILRDAAEKLEAMCSQSEAHFNTLVDLEEDYAKYHRKIITGLDNMHNNSQVLATAVGKIIQQHDRRSLSKKLPTTLFTLPSILRNPVLSL